LAHSATASGLRLPAALAFGPGERLVEIVDALVDVAGLEALLDAGGVDLDAEARLMPAIVAARGCAPPIPPRPAVRTSGRRFARSARSCALRAATKVSNVPCTMPCVPM
jgi:hypothetical protein